MSNDGTTSVGELKEEILNFASEREWEQFHSPKNLSMALAAEAGELMEHFLWMDSKESVGFVRDEGQRNKVSEELADVIIYAMEFANIAKIDVSQAIRRKMEINDKKYPVEKAKGTSRKYNEL